MRITDVRATYPEYEPRRSGWRGPMWQIVVEIDTDDGLTGLGVGGAGGAATYIINEHFRGLLLGRDPEDIETLWDELYDASLAYGRKGVAVMALSGVDLALWDLLGKARGEPVYRLLGAKAAHPVPAYATGNKVERYQRLGYRAFKLTRPRGPRDGPAGMEVNVAQVRAARELIGPEADLMLDAWMSWDVDYTLRMAELLAPYKLKWIEEPLSADDYAGYARLTAEIGTTSIAAGEHEYTHHGYQEFIERGCAHILQPDLTWCGGLTAALRILELAEPAGLPVIPHRGGEVWALHLVSARQLPLAELVIGDGEFPAGDPELAGAPTQQEGLIRPSDQPGFGVTIAPGLL